MKATSPWGDASRAPLRVLLAGLVSFDALLCGSFLWSLRPSSLSHRSAPSWLLGLGSNRPAIVGLVVMAIVAAALFARRPGRVGWGLAALGSVGLMVEAQAALLEGPMRFLFFTGACLLGWLAGLSFAALEGHDLGDDAAAQRAEAFAEQGAAAALGACYVGAVTSKLATSGVAWVFEAGLQATIAAQHAWGNSGALDALAIFALEHAWLTHALSALTIVAQASALMMPFSAVGRSIAGTLVLCFHGGVWLLTPISFPQAMILLVALSYPWPRWVARLGERRLPEARSAAVAAPWRGALAVGLAFAALAVLVRVTGVQSYAQSHHHRSASGSSAPLSARSTEALGDIAVGASFAGFTLVEAGEGEGGIIVLRLTRGAQVMVAQLVPRGLWPHQSPRSTARFDLYYRQDVQGEPAPSGAQMAALDALATRLSQREAPASSR